MTLVCMCILYSPVGFANVQYSGHTEHGVSNACKYRGIG